MEKSEYRICACYLANANRMDIFLRFRHFGVGLFVFLCRWRTLTGRRNLVVGATTNARVLLLIVVYMLLRFLVRRFN